ncbi:hypothetical protein MAXJ12_11747 [Mesorhizobium alhagi CCNWXJ12-2]|uniref:Uncharacterized protein n=1 Tax=Mesorhizobium alhagi CCNWXJ12-2 TaxID=1107882 RepID=H0HQB9_9HYPH|nr:hypothetical protein MAXJ12_11747 [Mesorhizobium alhagi CCNWXJ12-2]
MISVAHASADHSALARTSEIDLISMYFMRSAKRGKDCAACSFGM